MEAAGCSLDPGEHS